jgi:putative transposase
VNREVHAGFCESRAVRFRPATRLCERASVTEKYSFIDAEYENGPGNDGAAALTVVRMCALLSVSKSGYYEWRSRPQSETGRKHELLKINMKAVFEANNEEYGYRRVHRALVRGGEECHPELVRSIMREVGLESRASRSRGDVR